MKDYIDVTDNIGNKLKMEVISIFKLENYPFNYIVYKELDNSHYYAGKYTGDSIVDLDTNLSNEELELINDLFEGEVER